jgi:hypothetical protein
MAKRQPMQNVTAKALLARGIDPQAVNAAVQPGNGELLKNLIAQAFGPQMMQSPDNGIVYPPNTGNVERAFRPDEDIPAGLRKAGGSLEPIPRGPADPAYLRTRTSLVVNPVTTNRNAVKPGLQRGR